MHPELLAVYEHLVNYLSNSFMLICDICWN